jgi:hypothetical protein
MAERYSERILEYCRAAGIDVPAGFHRHPASRYAVIDVEATPPKLVARTWFKQEDVSYYLANVAAGRRVRVLDFKESEELLLCPDGSLRRGGGSFAP